MPSLALVLASGWIVAASGQTVDPAASRGAPHLFGEVTSDPERNTFGYPPLAAACAGPEIVFSPELHNVGPVTGDPEKDSLGHVVLGEHGCDDGRMLAGSTERQADPHR